MSSRLVDQPRPYRLSQGRKAIQNVESGGQRMQKTAFGQQTRLHNIRDQEGTCEMVYKK